MDSLVSLYVHTPLACFRKGFAREFFESEILPPPSTVYGFLLSLVGEEERSRHAGSRFAYGLTTTPKHSVILRTIWRFKSKIPPGTGANRRPDFQEMLTDIGLIIWIDEGELAQRVKQAGEHPENISRHGGLSLGESRDLVNEIRWYPESVKGSASFLSPDPEGDMSLPVWVDHVGSAKTIYQRFTLQNYPFDAPLHESDLWIEIPQGSA